MLVVDYRLRPVNGAFFSKMKMAGNGALVSVSAVPNWTLTSVYVDRFITTYSTMPHPHQTVNHHSTHVNYHNSRQGYLYD